MESHRPLFQGCSGLLLYSLAENKEGELSGLAPKQEFLSDNFPENALVIWMCPNARVEEIVLKKTALRGLSGTGRDLSRERCTPSGIEGFYYFRFEHSRI